VIFNILKHLVMALLLDAGAALAFGVDDPAAAQAATPPQSCALPAAAVADDDNQTLNSSDSGKHS
jgi:hypothetical protein